MLAELLGRNDSRNNSTPGASMREASIQRESVNKSWLVALVLTAVVAIVFLWRPGFLPTALEKVARTQSHPTLGLCSQSFEIDSIVSEIASLDRADDKVVYRLVDQDDVGIDMVFHALHDTSKAKLGLHEGFGIVTNNAETSRMNVSFLSSETQRPITLPYFAMSFFDLLGSEKDQHGFKHVRILGKWSDAIVSKDSSIIVEKQNYSVSLKASQTDLQQHSPSKPSALTADQMNHAGTVRFVNIDSFELQFEVGANEFHNFLFSCTAAVICADVKAEVFVAAPQFITNPHMFELPNMSLEHKQVVRAADPGVASAHKAVFQQWYVKAGDYVGTGDKIYRVAARNGSVEATAEMPGRVYYVQAVLPGDVIEPGVAMLILDTDTISWTQVSIIALVVIAAIAAVITWWYCCCRSKQETPDVDEPRVRAVILDFETDTGWNQRAIWKYQPLGLGFYENQVPLSVAYTGHDASHMGVLRDDVLVGIGDDIVGMASIKNKSFENVWMELKERVDQLPLAPRLLLKFESDKGTRIVHWHTKPLGLNLSETLPVKVTKVDEAAMHLGLEVGNVLKSYGMDPHLLKSVDGMTAKEIREVIEDRIAQFPDGHCLMMQFELPDKSIKEYQWRAQPVGLTFKSSIDQISVLKVTKSSLAEQKGIHEGYVLKRFGEHKRKVDVAEALAAGKNLSRIMKELEKFTDKLPSASSPAVLSSLEIIDTLDTRFQTFSGAD